MRCSLTPIPINQVGTLSTIVPFAVPEHDLDEGIMNGSRILKLIAFLVFAFLTISAAAQPAPLVLERDGRVISLVPYAPNVLRITMSVDKAAATAAPGYGITGMPSAAGWAHERGADGSDVFRSDKMNVR